MSETTRSALLDLASHESWATLQLLELCRALPRERRGLTAPGTYGSIEQTLAHIVGADEYYLYLLTGERSGQPPRSSPDVDLDDLVLRARRNAQLLERFAREPFNPDDPSRGQRGGRETRLGVVLAQLFHHGNEHRGQVRSILGANGIEPPDISVWAFAGGRETW